MGWGGAEVEQELSRSWVGVGQVDRGWSAAPPPLSGSAAPLERSACSGDLGGLGGGWALAAACTLLCCCHEQL